MTLDDRRELETEVKADESFRAKAYQDTEGVWTVGYGLNLQELVVSEPWAADQMRYTLRQRESDCLAAFPWFAGLTSARQRVILNMAYNLGMTRLRGFKKMLSALDRGDYETAAVEMLDSKWAEQVGARSTRLSDTMARGC